jgi:hypothetical protein
MRGLGWLILIVILIIGIWYFAFVRTPGTIEVINDSDENETGAILVNADLEIDSSDDGETFYYTPTTRFSVFLPEDVERSDINLSCSPSDGILEVVNNIPEAPEGFYAVVYEAVTLGSCLLTAGDFAVNIQVVEERSINNADSTLQNLLGGGFY